MMFISSSWYGPRLIAAFLRRDRPGDPRRFVGKRGCQNIMIKRFAAAESHGPKLCFAQFAGLSRITRAPCMNSIRK